MEEANWKDCLDYAAESDIGMRRKKNQDGFTVVLASNEEQWLSEGHLFMVADGMGAHAAGEYASKLAIDNVPSFYKKFKEKSPREAIENAFHATNEEIHSQGKDNPDYFSMGTTGSLLLLASEGAYVAHVGDSRIYRQRGQNLEQLTFDHSLVWEMQAAGKFSKQKGLSLNVPKNVITRSLGSHAAVEVDTEGPFPIKEGDKFLLCSDGLTGKVSDQEIAEITAHLTPSDAVPLLVDLANLRGGPDNVTVIVVSVTGNRLVSTDSDDLPTVKRTSRQVIFSLSWVIVALLSLSGAAYLWHLEMQNIALSVATGGVIGFVLAIWGWLGKTAGTDLADTTERLQMRQAPYSKTSCPTRETLAEDLLQTVDFYRNEALESNWPVNWESLEECYSNGSSSQRDRRSADAIKEYASSIHCLTLALREKKE